ncbi:MAG: glucosidase family protein [Armatimonadota bacterium]
MTIKLFILATSILAISLPAIAEISKTIDSTSLSESITKPRWLSIPHSRLVLNPAGGYDFQPMKPPIADGFGPGLSANLAYWVGKGEPVKLPMFWSWQPVVKDSKFASGVVGESIDLLHDDKVELQKSDVNVEIAPDMTRVILNKDGYGHLECKLDVDLDKTPYVLVDIKTINNSRWALKINDGTLASDAYLKGDTSDSGDYLADIRAITGWKGRKSLSIKLFIVGDANSIIECPVLKCVGPKTDCPSLEVKNTTWAPHAITIDAICPLLNTKLTAATFFADESTIAQTIHVNDTQPVSLILRGYFPDGKVHWDSSHRALIFDAKDYRAVLAINRDAEWLGTSPSCVKALTGNLDKTGASGMWTIIVDDVKPGDDICLVTRFSVKNFSNGNILEKAVNMVNTNSLSKALKTRESTWNKILARVPQPQDFSMHSINDRGITPEQIQRAYYRAWVFLMQDILPPMPENGYTYPQVTCGKPSLWSEGHPKSKGSAQWESIVAMLFTACIDPESTWASFEGMMSLVDDKGMMGGEGLPARHSQAAWVLFTETGDKEHLRKCYPAMKRLLQWKIDDPRWVYKGLTEEGMKDIEFVFHALMDLQYMIKITDTLDMPSESAYWQGQRAILSKNLKKWFWDKPGGSVYRVYSEKTDKRSSPDSSWSIPTIVLPPGIMNRQERMSIIKLFKSSLDPNMPFLIWNLTKHPSLSYTMRGAYQYGLVDEASDLAEAIMRDISAAGEFAETYHQAFPPVTTGVTPSNFGAMNIIDAALWHNGIMYGDGLPVIIRLPYSSGVENLSIRGKRISVRFDEKDIVTLTGDGLNLLRLPEGYTSIRGEAAPCWRGNLKTGSQLTLQFNN